MSLDEAIAVYRIEDPRPTSTRWRRTRCLALRLGWWIRRRADRLVLWALSP